MVHPNQILGAHVSIAGGVHHAIETGYAIGATTVQIFTANQRTWNTKPISSEELEKFKKALQETKLQQIMSHASYLINIGSPKEEMREKSLRALREEIMRSRSLGISYVNLHPGAALESSKKTCLDTIVRSLLSIADCFAGADTMLLLETTAGQGTLIGSRFEELGYIVKRVKDYIPIGVCMDTCHSFAAGYDLRSQEGLKETLDLFESVVGCEYLKAMHLNDSKFGLGQRKDRHAPIGEGEIGKRGFSAIMNEPRLLLLPKYLETPGGPEVWKDEITWLKQQIF